MAETAIDIGAVNAHEPEAEKAILGIMMLTPDSVSEVRRRLEVEDFYIPQHQIIFAAACELDDERLPVEPTSLISKISRNGKIKNTADMTVYLTELLSSAPASASLGYYAGLVRDAATRRGLANVGVKMQQLAALNGADNPTSIVEEMRNALDNLAVDRIGSEVPVADEILALTLEEIDALASGKTVAGIPTGFTELDYALNGLRPGQMIIVAARPGVGKMGHLDEVIITPNGYTTFGEISLGDKVIGIDGNQYNVTGVHPIETDLETYEVTFDDGTSVRVGGDHEWYTETRSSRRSANSSRKQDAKRETILPEKVINKLKAELSSTNAYDTMHLVSLAQLVGLPSANPTMIRIASMLPSVGQTVYTRNVERKSKVYNSSEVAKVLYDNSRLSRIHEDATIYSKVATMVHAVESKKVTINEISYALFGEDSNESTYAYLYKVITNNGVPAEYETRSVEYPSGRPINLYNKLELLSAYISHAESYKNDQREYASLGSVKTTIEIMNSLIVGNDNRYNHSIPVAKALLGEEKELPVAPYTLGAWLGDGYSRKPEICGMDHEVFSFIELDGYLPSTVLTKEGAHADYRSITYPSLKQGLSQLGLLVPRGSAKRIPVEYLRASISQRKALLAGLMDTDGTCTENSAMVQFSNSNKDLIDDVWELVASLGYNPSISSKIPVNTTTKKEGKLSYTISWSTLDDVFGISRKIEKHRRGIANTNFTPEKNRHRFIVKVEAIGKQPMRCISVDAPNNLFLVSRSFIATHNSSLMMDIVRHAAFKQKKSVLVFSLEMSKTEVMMRALSGEAYVDLHSLKTGNLDDHKWQQISKATAKMAGAKLGIDDNAAITMTDIRAQARSFQRAHGLDMIAIDYLQLMNSDKRTDSRQQEVSEISRGIKLLAKEFGVPVLALSQLNRGSEQRSDKKPAISDLRESGSLEQDADVVILLHREEIYDKESPRAGEADVIIAKQRSGPTGTIILSWLGKYSRFDNRTIPD
jgi:replicative DNA helicase